MKLKPLEEWICDFCQDMVDESNGYVIWNDDSDLLAHDFRIIHKVKCDDKSFFNSSPIDSFLGEDGKSRLLSFLSLGIVKIKLGSSGVVRIKDMDEFVDFFRRLQTPYYEEARIKLEDHEILTDFNDTNEIYPYQIDVLRRIVEES